MSDTHGHGATRPNETFINTSGVTGWVTGVVLLVPVLLVGVYSYFQKVAFDEMRVKVMERPTTELDASRTQWAGERSSFGPVTEDRYGWIPVDVAKDVYLSREKARREAEAAAQALLQPEGVPVDGQPPADAVMQPPEGGATP